MDALHTLAALSLGISLPGSLYLATLTLAAALPRPDSNLKGVGSAQPESPPLRVVMLVPAHNEAGGLLRCLQSLQAELLGDENARIVVIADNCDDATAALARAAGVEVLERHHAQLRGKGYALQYAFEQIAGADWFIVIDADTDVERGFLAKMRSAMASGADALQCRYGVRDALSSPRATLADVALGAWNVLRPRGRQALGLSVGILGNGFALSRRTLQALPYSAGSIVEDVEYHQMLVAKGLRVQWVDDTQVRGEMPEDQPDGQAQAAQQRARWEGGRLRLLIEQGWPLAYAVFRGRWRLLDPLLDLCLLPLAWHVSLLLIALLLGSGGGSGGSGGSGGYGVQGLAAAGLLSVALHIGLALHLIKASRAHLRALLGVPRYLCWKLSLAGAIWRNSARHAAWVRSARRDH